MSDPFRQLRRLAMQVDRADHELRSEVQALRSLGFSLRAIAGAAGMSPDTVMRWTR